MSQPKHDNLIGSFLRSLLPPETERAYQTLASLEYPIPDLRTFREQVKRHGGDDEAVRTLSSLFEPEDFGMDTAQSAFEKFAKRGRHLNLPGVPLPRAGLQVLADVIAAGGIIIKESAVVFRSKGAVEVDCACADSVGNKATGNCKIVVTGNICFCDQGNCTGTCGMTVTIPTVNFLSLREASNVIF